MAVLEHEMAETIRSERARADAAQESAKAAEEHAKRRAACARLRSGAWSDKQRPRRRDCKPLRVGSSRCAVLSWATLTLQLSASRTSYRAPELMPKGVTLPDLPDPAAVKLTLG